MIRRELLAVVARGANNSPIVAPIADERSCSRKGTIVPQALNTSNGTSGRGATNVVCKVRARIYYIQRTHCVYALVM